MFEFSERAGEDHEPAHRVEPNSPLPLSDPFDLLLRLAGQALGGVCLKWDAQGCCLIRIDHYHLRLVTDRQDWRLIVCLDIGELESNGTTPLLRQALVFNHYSLEKPAPQFSLDSDRNMLCMFNAFSAALDEQAFLTFMEDFLSTFDAITHSPSSASIVRSETDVSSHTHSGGINDYA